MSSCDIVTGLITKMSLTAC